MKIVQTYINSQLAHLDLAKLSDEEIDAFLQDDNVASINPLYAQAIGGIKLLVRDEDYDRAVEVLKLNDYEYLHNEYPDEEISGQRKCIRCGSINVYQKSFWLIALLYMILFFIPIVIKKKKYVCLDCGHKWKEI